MNTWISGQAYGNAGDTFTSGTGSDTYNGFIYIMKESTGRHYKFDVSRNELIPFNNLLYPQSTAIVGNKVMVNCFIDGATVVPYLYVFQHSRQEAFRIMIY